MNFFRKGLRKLIHILGENKLVSPLSTIKWLHFAELGRFPNLSNPKDINEKLIWIEYKTDSSQRSLFSDKYEVRNFVTQKGFNANLIPLLGVFESFNKIDFSKLPDSFILKATNGSSQSIIVKNKSSLDLSKTESTIKKWFKKPFGLATGESHYINIPPRLIIEKLLLNDNQTFPLDYKFYCYNGRVDSCLIVSERSFNKSGETNYKLNLVNPFSWESIPDAVLPYYEGEGLPSRPQKIDEMIKIASKLSEGFPFVRIDLYEVEGKVYFGEMTFTPAGCRTPYLTRKTLDRLGEQIHLP